MNVSASLGIYDFLNFLIIGAVLSLIFVPWVPYSTEELALWTIPCFIVGLVFHKIVENSIGKLTRNNNELIKIAFEEKAKFCDIDIKTESPNWIEKEYYRAYYYLMEKDKLGCVPLLEAQSSFLQNLTVALSLYEAFSISSYFYNHLDSKCFTIHFVYDIVVVFSFLSIIFVIYCIPWNKMDSKYCKYIRWIYFFLVMLFFFLMANIGTQYLKTDCDTSWFKSMMEKLGSDSLILFPLDVCMSIQFAVLIFLLLLPPLRFITEKKIYGLVWEGYIFLNVNKEKNIHVSNKKR